MPHNIDSLQAKDLMTSPAKQVTEESCIKEAAEDMLENRIGALAVVDANGKYRGVISERMLLPHKSRIPFLREAIYKVLATHHGSISDLVHEMERMGDEPVKNATDYTAPCVAPEAAAIAVAEIIITHDAHHVPVVDNGTPVGMISRHDFLKVYTSATEL